MLHERIPIPHKEHSVEGEPFDKQVNNNSSSSGAMRGRQDARAGAAQLPRTRERRRKEN